MLQIVGVLALCLSAGLIVLSGGDAREKKARPNSQQQSIDERRAARRRQARRSRETARGLKPDSRQKPNLLLLDDAEERELTDLARKVLASLQAALDSEDYSQIAKILAMAQDAPKGSLGKTTDGMPVVLRKKIVEAMGWFGAKALPEMIGFLGDPNQEVYQMSLDQFELALSDITLGDRDRARIVTMASTVLTDHDALEQIFMEIANMRNSVAADTMYSICMEGTPEAKAQMPEVIEFVTGEENITTVEDLTRWKNENPDGPDDEDLYGPMSDGSDEE